MAKIVRDWTKLIVPRVNDNNFPNTEKADKSLNTTDLVSLKSWDEVSARTDEERRRSLTDFALMNYAWQSSGNHSLTGKLTGAYWLRSARFNDITIFISTGGSRYYNAVITSTSA